MKQHCLITSMALKTASNWVTAETDNHNYPLPAVHHNSQQELRSGGGVQGKQGNMRHMEMSTSVWLCMGLYLPNFKL
jgi:hypothetical protein